jgi:hypothetical protein
MKPAPLDKAPRAGFTPRVWRRFAFFGVNALFTAALAFTLAPLARWALDDSDSLADQRDLLARHRAVAAQESAVRDYARQVKESNARGDLLEGGSAGIVNAALQSRLKAMGEQAGVTVLSIQTLPPKKLETIGEAAGAPNLLGARLAVSGALEAVHRLTLAIESGPPLLLIEAAIITQNVTWLANGDDAPTVQAQFDVYGGALELDTP